MNCSHMQTSTTDKKWIDELVKDLKLDPLEDLEPFTLDDLDDLKLLKVEDLEPITLDKGKKDE